MPARTLNARVSEKVEIRLLELQLAAALEALDERVLQLELADEADAIGEAVRDEQHEAVEVDDAVLELALRVVEVHVAGEAGCRRWRLGLCGCLGRRATGRGTAETGP